MSRVAVAILNYNGADHLKKFLPTLIQWSPLASVYVIDNASTDDSLKFLESQEAVNIIQLKENHGFAEGYNLGLGQIDSEYFILLNSDVEVTENWIEPMLQFLDDQPQYVACQPKVLSYNNKDQFEHAGAAGGFIDFLGYPFCRGRILHQTEKDLGQYDDPIEVLWTSGACMMIRASTFRALGGFDIDFFAHMEEIDLCWRIHQENKKAMCLPQSVVYHVGGGTLKYGSSNKTYLNFRNSLIVLCKNLPFPHLVFVLMMRVGLDILAAISMWSWDHFKAIMRANRDFYRSIGHHFSKRNKPKRVPRRLGGNKWILILYYIGGKNKFSKL